MVIVDALHQDVIKRMDDLHDVSYLGALHLALRDLNVWVERGGAISASTNYEVHGGQMIVPPDAAARGHSTRNHRDSERRQARRSIGGERPSIGS